MENSNTFVLVEGQPRISLKGVIFASITISKTLWGKVADTDSRRVFTFKPAGTRRGGLNGSVEPGDVTHHQVQPNGKKHVTTEADSPRVTFQTYRRGVQVGTFENAESTTQLKIGKEQDRSLPFSISSKPEPLCNMGS